MHLRVLKFETFLDYFKEVGFWQYSSHVSATTFALKSINKYRSLSSAIFFIFNVQLIELTGGHCPVKS